MDVVAPSDFVFLSRLKPLLQRTLRASGKFLVGATSVATREAVEVPRPAASGLKSLPQCTQRTHRKFLLL